MTHRLLVLGGTAFVGRAVVEAAVEAGWSVTTFTRGVTGRPPAGVEEIRGDRTNASDLRLLTGREWDLVVDTWRDDPSAVEASATVLGDSAARYVYVSSLAVYQWPPPPAFTEAAPLVDVGRLGEDDFGTYSAAKAGGERAVREVFGERSLLARTGLILGPYEYVGRLPWWLSRMARGGDVLAPLPRERPLQYVDCRDVAAWLLSAGKRGLTGAYNVVSEAGHTTMAGLLGICRDVTGSVAEPVWVDERFLLDHGVRPWFELPIWLPSDDPLAGTYDVDVSRAMRAGLRCRPAEETVVDTWRWLRELPGPEVDRRAGQHKSWLHSEKEAAVLSRWRHQVG